MEEIHLFIIWSKALDKENEIISDIKKSFDILCLTKITWDKHKFSENLSRLYGENLPKDSNKENHCGNDTFSCIVVKDNTPIYKTRNTSKGDRVVNVNLFDAKQLYRSWTGGGHKIHATDNVEETKFQTMLLFGRSYNYYLDLKDDKKIDFNRHDKLIGENGWKSLESVFIALNETFQYIILRNFEFIEDELNSEHPDIDLLVEDVIGVSNLLNAKRTSNKKNRVQYQVLIANKLINLDLRCIGDNYYYKNWQIHMLLNRVKESYYYQPCIEDHYYSLLYHALYHKAKLGNDYKEKLLKLKQDINPTLNERDIDFGLNGFLCEINSFILENKYKITQPNDYSVYWNYRLNFKIKVTWNLRRLIYRMPYFFKRLLNR